MARNSTNGEQERYNVESLFVYNTGHAVGKPNQNWATSRDPTVMNILGDEIGIKIPREPQLLQAPKGKTSIEVVYDSSNLPQDPEGPQQGLFSLYLHSKHEDGLECKLEEIDSGIAVKVADSTLYAQGRRFGPMNLHYKR